MSQKEEVKRITPGLKKQLEEAKRQTKVDMAGYKATNGFKDLWKLPYAKLVIVSGGVFLFFYLGKYLIREIAGFVEASKRLNRAVNRKE